MNFQRNGIDLAGVGAVYRRVSDDAQDIERQRAETDRFLKHFGATVSDRHTYEDLGWKRHQAAERPAFQRLLKAVAERRVNWILVDRQDRFEAGDKFEFISIIHRLRESGCRLYTVDGREVTAKDIGSFLQTALASEQSEAELREKAVRVVSAKLERAKRGEWQGGHVPYGMDVVCFELPDMAEQWRVQINGRDARVKLTPDGQRKEYNGKGNFPPTELGQILQLRPTTNKERLEVVRDIFKTYATQSISLAAIAKKLNRSGVKANYGAAWEGNNVWLMLSNPIYLGQASWNKHSQARYVQFVGGQRREVNKRTNVRFKREEWTVSEQLFEPVIDEKTWSAVQRKLEAQEKGKKHRAPKNPTLWLSRLLVCGHCGKTMRAFPRPSGKGEYCCSTYSKSVERGTPTCCQRNSVLHSTLEEYVRKFLEESGATLDNARKGWDAPQPQYQQKLSEASAWDSKMAQRLIENGMLALAYDDYATDEQRMEAYRVIYGRELPALKERYATLNAEHDQLTARILNLPSGAKLAIQKASSRLEELERLMEETKAKMTNAADEYSRSLAEFMTIHEEWAAAQRAMTVETSAREKAEAVSKVIARIVLLFRPTGRKHPATELDKVTIVPHEDDRDGFGGNDDGTDGGGNGGNALKTNGNGACVPNVPITISSSPPSTPATPIRRSACAT